jgi:hypothetical protein
VLLAIGKTADEIDALVSAGIVSESWSTKYLPD